MLVVTSVRLQTEYERRRKAERSLARTRAEMAVGGRPDRLAGRQAGHGGGGRMVDGLAWAVRADNGGVSPCGWLVGPSIHS